MAKRTSGTRSRSASARANAAQERALAQQGTVDTRSAAERTLARRDEIRGTYRDTGEPRAANEPGTDSTRTTRASSRSTNISGRRANKAPSAGAALRKGTGRKGR
jgi:hypothetical protein